MWSNYGISPFFRAHSRPKTDVFTLATCSKTSFAGSIKLPVGKSVTFTWGDGTSDNTYNGNGSTAVPIAHTYADTAGYLIQLSGDYLDLTWLRVGANSLSGDISGWSVLVNLERLEAYQNSLTGNIESWSALTSLTYIYVGNNNGVTGDISFITALTSLGTFNMYQTGLTGDITNLSGLTSLTYIYLSAAGIIGDVVDLIPLTSLSNCDLRNCATDFSTTTAWTGHNHTVTLTSNDYTSTEVDNALIGFANGGSFSGKAISLAGTNAARTSASDAAVATLEAAGNTIITTA